MKKKELYRHLVDAASRIGIRVAEQNLRATGVNAKSGLCQVKGEYVYIMDKKLPDSEKAGLLAQCLRNQSLDDIYIIPAVREFIDNNGGRP